MEDAGLGGVRVVRLPAYVDAGNAMGVWEALDAELRNGASVLVADLAATIGLTLEGLQVFVLARAAASRRGAKLRLAAVRPAVLTCMKTTGTARMFSVHDSVEQARLAL